MSRVSTGLLSMIRVLGSLPIIRAQSGGAADMLAQEICSLLKENISARGPAQSLFEVIIFILLYLLFSFIIKYNIVDIDYRIVC